MSVDAKEKVPKKAQGFSCRENLPKLQGGGWGREVPRSHLGEE